MREQIKSQLEQGENMEVTEGRNLARKHYKTAHNMEAVLL